ncbi:histidine phosphatase family protein [Candidatus Roizmanbacteria bacterium]|nr:histidine phosphatase family protein [Candidatus Roizmanbacteria bacterium]
MVTTFYVIRHGQSKGNVLYEQRVDHSEHFKKAGTLGSPLSLLGSEQAEELARIFANKPIDYLFSSDMVRAQQTAEAIARKKGLTLTTDSSIRERNYGEYGGILHKLYDALRPLFINLTDEEKLNYEYPGVLETAKDGAMRLRNFLEIKHKELPGKTIAVVCHGNIMRSFLIMNGFASFDALTSGTIKNCGYFKAEYDGRQFRIIDTHRVQPIMV